MRNKAERIIPKKNYFIITLLFIALIGLSLYFSSWYKEIKNYYTNNTIITEAISEIEINSLSSYLLDNPEIIIYISSSNDLEVKDFERKFKKYINDKNLKDSIVYLDLAKEENANATTIIKDNYLLSNLKNVSDINEPNLIYFKDGVIKDILYIKKKNISKEDMINFFNRNELLEK